MSTEYDVRQTYQRRIFELENQVKLLLEKLSEIHNLRNPPSIIFCTNCPKIKNMEKNDDLV